MIGSNGFGIQCCPVERGLNFGDRDPESCNWYGGSSGDSISCPDQQAAFGRCSTSAREDAGGDCGNVSHQTQCCSSNASVKESSCGYIYGSYGTKTNCPNGLVVAGFCGVNNKGSFSKVLCQNISKNLKLSFWHDMDYKLGCL